VGYQQNAGHRSLMRRRRDFIALLGGTISWPLTSRAQTPNRHRIAFLVTGTPLIGQPYIETFRQDLRALGYSDDDLAIEARFAEGKKVPSGPSLLNDSDNVQIAPLSAFN
jgi:hypothetical protein